MAIDLEDTKNSLFGDLKKKETSEVQNFTTPESQKFATFEPPNLQSSKTPKWKTFEKVTALLTREQKDGLDWLAKELMRSRTERGERVTTNTVLRAWIDILFLQIAKVNYIGVNNEDELRKLFLQLFK